MAAVRAETTADGATEAAGGFGVQGDEGEVAVAVETRLRAMTEL